MTIWLHGRSRAVQLNFLNAIDAEQVFQNPDTFNVNNFSPSAIKGRSEHHFRPFGHGCKGCVGTPLAWLEMKEHTWATNVAFKSAPSIFAAPASMLLVVIMRLVLEHFRYMSEYGFDVRIM